MWLMAHQSPLQLNNDNYNYLLQIMHAKHHNQICQCVIVIKEHHV